MTTSFPSCTFGETVPKWKTGDLFSKEIEQSTYGQYFGVHLILALDGWFEGYAKPVYSPLTQSKQVCQLA